MIIDINKQRVTSDLVELYQVEIPSGYAYFTTYPTAVTFRDFYPSPTNYAMRTYTPLPITFTGYESKADGAYSRPRISFANILTTFKDALGSNDDLIGRKVIRRKTLFSQLATGSNSTPPVELPKQVFIVDRIESESPTQVIFELAAPFDLAGVKVPGRYIIPNTCAWVYQGNAADRTLPKVGGCTWRQNNSNPGFAVYYDYNNYLIALDTSFATHTGGAYTKNTLYKVAKTLVRVNPDGSVTTGQSGFDYWQAITTGTGALTTSNSRRCRAYKTTYNSGTTYYTYKEGRLYSDVVFVDNKMWACSKSHSNRGPIEGSSYWERIDVCSKKLSSCAIRFKATQNGGVTLVDQNETKVLPYGGFPAARRFNR